jgi:hypothetical protein
LFVVNWAAGRPRWKDLIKCWKKKNPAGLVGEQGSRKSGIWDQIVNYLLASLVRSSVARNGCVMTMLTTLPSKPKPGFRLRWDIPAQLDRPVVCQFIGYVLSEFIGDEGKS